MSDLVATEISDLVNSFDSMSTDDIRSLIHDIEQRAISIVNEDKSLEADVPVTNHFSKGVYAREIFIPKGSFIIGKIHKHENLNILSKGDISILSIDGVMRVKAPFTVVSSPGVKRLAYAHEDTVWTTIHGTDETDVDKIESEFIAKDYSEVNLIDETKKLKELV
jgi:hypothetical protein